MNERRRMISVLGSLVLMMTGTAYLLSMIQPSTTEQVRMNPIVIAEKARTAVGNDLMIPENRWREVELDGLTSSLRTGETLTAVTQTNDYHFVITADGQVQSCRPWSNQAQIDKSPATVRIAILFSETDPALTDYQEVALDTVLNELDKRCSKDGELLACRIQKADTDQAHTFALSLLNHLDGTVQ